MTDEKTIKALEQALRVADETINRQKAEIERWKEQNVRLNKECDHFIRFASTARAEAIREFAERLRTKRGSHGEIWGEDINNLVKEMTEETP